MCNIHSAIVSCCELPVCMLCAAASCLCAAVCCCVLLCAAVITVIVLQSSLSSCCSHLCLDWYPRLLSPQKAFASRRRHERRCMSCCECLYRTSACLSRLQRRLLYIVGTAKMQRAKEARDVSCTCVYVCTYKCVIYTVLL